MTVQQSNPTIWIHVLSNKNLGVLEISKVVLDVFCTACHRSLCSSSLPLIDYIFDVILVGFFCGSGFLQVMDGDDIDTSGGGAWGTFNLPAFSRGPSTSE